MAGRLVHRLFEYAHRKGPEADAAAEQDLARRLLKPEERATVGDAAAVVSDALHAWRALRGREDVQRALRSGVCLYEVPFSLQVTETASIVRGTIDCLVHRQDGSVLVIELKTGARRPEHDQQLATYVCAARALFPTSPVDGILLYP